MSGTKVINAHEAYRRPEEPINFITYAVAACVTVVGLVFLLLKTVESGWLAMVAVIIFGGLNLCVFVSGAVAHVAPYAKVRNSAVRFEKNDVTLAVAGLCAPIMLVGMQRGTAADGIWGYAVFAIVVCAAAIAIIINVFDVAESTLFSLVLYIIIGWACAVRIDRIVELYGFGCFWTVICGAIMYLVGIVINSFEELPSKHILRHIFVMCGTSLAFTGIYSFLL